MIAGSKVSGIYIFFLLVWVGIIVPANLYSQTEEIQISSNYDGVPFPDFVNQVEQQHPVHFYFIAEWVETLNIRQPQSPMTLTALLDSTLQGTDLSFLLLKNRIYLSKDRLVRENPTPVLTRVSPIVRRPEPTLIRFTPPLPVKPSETREETPVPVSKVLEIGETKDKPGTQATIVGYVKDILDGEPLVGAAVFVDDLQVGTITDQYGYYSLTLPIDKHEVTFRSYGKEEKKQEIILRGDGFLDIEMEAAIIELDEVVIESEQSGNINNSQMGLDRMNIQTLKQMPALMGEIDVIKSTLMLPGVQSVGEGASGFNVRGGNADQNLILINQAPVFNPSHLFGFFSVFNPDVIKSFDLYKSEIPARYGGRLASVLDIAMKDGNKRELVGSGGISPLTARFTVEGPIQKYKSSFILGGRSTYSDWILKRLPDPDLRNSKAGFYDINGKINLELSEKDRLDLSGYFSRDNFVFNGDTAYTYRNLNGSLNWKHLFNNKLFAVTSAIFSQYNYQIAADSVPETAFQLQYQIRYHEAKTDFTFIPRSDHQIRFGLNAILYSLNPGSRQALSPESLVTDQILEQERAIESGLYISEEWDITPRLNLYAGLRYSLYFMLGPNELAQYRDGFPRISQNMVGTTQFESGDLVQTYAGPEARLSVRYALDSHSSLKLSYNRLRQYLHMLSNTTSISPTDTWKLSDPFIRPQIGDQLSLGYYRSFRQNSIEASVEVYVKRIKDMLEFKGGAQLLLNPYVETDVINGLGRAYGAEFLIKKERGKLNGWISYTYSRVFSQVNGTFPDEIINGGKPFPTNVDKPHNVSLVSNFKFSRRLSISSNFTYSTGRPITFPVSQYVFGNSTRTQYSLRNQFRIPDYYRWDASINFEGNHKVEKLIHTSWSFSVFNILGRRNPYSIYFVSGASGIEGYQLSIFGRPIATLTLNFRI